MTHQPSGETTPETDEALKAERSLIPLGNSPSPPLLRQLLRDRRTGCGWAYLIGLVLGVPGVFILPGNIAMLLLWLLVISALVIAAQDAELRLRDFLNTFSTLRDFIRGQPSRLDTHRGRITRLGVLLAVILMSLSAVGFRPANRNPDLGDAIVLMLLGLLALGVAVIAARPHDSRLLIPDVALTRLRSHWLLLLAGVVLLLAVAEINGRVLNLNFTHRVAFYVQGLLFYGGIACVVWGLAGGAWGGPRLPVDWRARRVEWALLGGIMLLALGLRVFGLDTTLRVSVDEAVIIPGIFHVWNPSDVGLVAPPSAYQTTLLFAQWQTITVGLFGTNLVGLRMASAITGALGVLALYLLARTLFDRPAALLAALLLATFPPHIHFSRIALLHIADPLFGTLALAFAARGLYHNRRLDWALAGAALGLTHYFFEAGRLFYTPLLVGWLAALLLMRQPLRSRWPGLVVLGIAFLFTILPAYYTLLAQGQTSTARLEQSGLNLEFWQVRLAQLPSPQAVSDILHRLTFPFQVYIHQNEIAVFYGGEQALVLETLVPLFLLGVGYLVWRARGVGVVVLLWLIAAALSNALLRDSAVYARWVVVFPAVALALAVGLRYVLTLLAPRELAWAGLATALLLGVGVAAAQATYYYGPHLTRLNIQARMDKPYPDALDAALRAVETLPPQTDIVIVSDPIADANVPRAFLGFMLAGQLPNTMTLRTFDSIEIDATWLAELPTDRNLAFFLRPDDYDTLERIQQFYRVQPASASPHSAVIPAQRALVLHFAPVGTRLDAAAD